MTKHVHEFGRRWNAQVPRTGLRFLVDRLHVGVSDQEIADDITRRVAGKPGFTPAIVRQSIAFAIECHHRNQGLFTRVMSGRL